MTSSPTAQGASPCPTRVRRGVQLPVALPAGQGGAQPAGLHAEVALEQVQRWRASPGATGLVGSHPPAPAPAPAPTLADEYALFPADTTDAPADTVEPARCDCPFPDGSVVTCPRRGIAFIEDCRLRGYPNKAAFAAAGKPTPLEDSEATCAKMEQCIGGDPMPAPGVPRVPPVAVAGRRSAGGAHSSRRCRAKARRPACPAPPCPALPCQPRAECPHPDGSVLRCASSGYIARIEEGMSRGYSYGAWVAAGRPSYVDLAACDWEDSWKCPKGDDMPAPATGDFGAKLGDMASGVWEFVEGIFG